MSLEDSEVSQPGTFPSTATREENSAGKMMSIEAYLASSDNYYGSYPYVGKVPMHVWAQRSGTVIGSLYSHDEVNSFIGTTLERLGIQYRRRGLYRRQAYHPNGLCALPCINIDASSDHAAFQEAAEAIYRYVSTFGRGEHEDFLVEVYDSHSMGNQSPSRCPSSIVEELDLPSSRTQAFDKASQLLHPNLVAVGSYLMSERNPAVRRNPAYDWFTGYTPAEQFPTIGIWIKEGTVADFEKCERELRAVGEGLNSTARVQFLLTGEAQCSMKYMQRDDFFERPLAAGCSISSLGDDNAGTLGGFVMLSKGEEHMPVFMTAANIIRPADPTEAEDVVKNGFNRGSGRSIEVQYPAKSTLTDCQFNTETGVARWLETVEESRESLKMNGDKGLPERDARILEALPDYLKESQDKLLKIKTAINEPPVIGTVVHASPITRGPSGNRMDWALVEMNDKTIVPKTKVPKPDMRERSGPLSNVYNCALRYPSLDINKMTKGQWVIMEGHESRATTGYTNGDVTEIALADQPGKKTWAWQIFRDEKDGTPEQHWRPFGAPGDSGAWVYDPEVNLVGMFRGGFDSLGLVTPMEEIVKDIKERTGKEVTCSFLEEQ